jgi:beta-galactosidase
METDGVTVARGGKEYVLAIGEIKNIQKHYQPNPIIPKSVAFRRTAFLWKQDNLWEMQANPHTKSWDTWQHYYTYYGNLKAMGAPVQFIQETDDFDPVKFPFMVAPAHSMVDKKVIAKWAKYVEDGGHLILSCRTGQKDNNGHFHETLLQQPIWELIGAKIEDNDQLPPENKATVKADGKYYSWNVWGELIKPNDGTETLAVYSDQFYAGTSAVVTRKPGKGTVTYVGVWTTDGELEKYVLRTIYQRAGAEILDLPNYVFVEWRDGFWVGVNYTSQPVKLPIPQKSNMLMGTREIQPGEVAVWMEP